MKNEKLRMKNLAISQHYYLVSSSACQLPCLPSNPRPEDSFSIP
jgi:hypothetical protein